jgi:chemotaxis protein methyltransferase CheR
VECFREFEFTDDDFNRIRSLIGLHTGISVSEAKRELVYSRLARRLRHLGINRFEKYCRLLETGDSSEVPQFINAVTTNLTSFFREIHHFHFLAEKVLSEQFLGNSRERKLRIWSAGCSTGEEPYSIAITASDCLRNKKGWDLKILATDIDSNVLDIAGKGIYPEERIRSLPSEMLQCYFKKGIGSNQGMVRVSEELKDVISFLQLNLLEPWPFKSPFDAIFCRNVVIYFDKQNQRTLFDRFANALRPEGYLFIGHSESLFNISNRFELVGKTVYRRRY